MSALRERIIEALAAAGREPEETDDGWIRYRCLEHEGRSAYLGERGFYCHSCDSKGGFKELADRLKVPAGGTYVRGPEQLKLDAERDAKRERDRKRRVASVRLIWPSLKMTAQGRWYLDEHRGLDADFAESYGVRSFNAGCWPVAELKPPGTIHRRGGLIIPYYFQPGELPVSFRVRAALPDEYTKRPEHITAIAKAVGEKPSKFWPEPSRYWAPKGHVSMLFNEVELRREEPIDELWVSEGEIDCLTLLQEEVKAVGLPGKAASWSRLRYYLERRTDISTVFLVPDDEPSTIKSFTKKAKELSLVSNASFHVMCPVAGDLDGSLKAVA